MTAHQMSVAIRVLVAINKHQTPDPADVDLLRACLPAFDDGNPDELASIVIEQSRQRRKVARSTPLKIF